MTPNVREALRRRQRGFLLNPYRFGGAGGGGGNYLTTALSLGATGYYDFEEASGSVVVDQSSFSRNGVYSSAILPSAPGLLPVGPGSAKSITTASNQYLTLPNAALPAGVGGASIAFFASWTSGAGNVILERGVGNVFSIRTDNSVAGQMTLYGSGGATVSTNLSTLNDGVPRHFVIVVSSTLAQCFIYVDGVDRTTRVTSSAFASDSADWLMGSRLGSFGYGGTLDELAFFDGVRLSSSDVANLYVSRNVP